MIAHHVDERHAYAALDPLARRIDVRLDDHDDRRRGARSRIVGELADAARHENSNISFAADGAAEARGAHRLAEARVHFRVGQRHAEREHVGRFPQPLHVAVEQERLPVVRAQRLVHPLAVQEPVIEYGDHRVLRIGDAAIDVDGGCHAAEF